MLQTQIVRANGCMRATRRLFADDSNGSTNIIPINVNDSTTSTPDGSSKSLLYDFLQSHGNLSNGSPDKFHSRSQISSPLHGSPISLAHSNASNSPTSYRSFQVIDGVAKRESSSPNQAGSDSPIQQILAVEVPLHTDTIGPTKQQSPRPIDFSQPRKRPESISIMTLLRAALTRTKSSSDTTNSCALNVTTNGAVLNCSSPGTPNNEAQDSLETGSGHDLLGGGSGKMREEPRDGVEPRVSVCPYCSKTFQYRSSFRRHVKIHQGIFR